MPFDPSLLEPVETGGFNPALLEPVAPTGPVQTTAGGAALRSAARGFLPGVGAAVSGAAGYGLGALLAPETGGLSLLLPAIGAFIGAGAGGVLTEEAQRRGLRAIAPEAARNLEAQEQADVAQHPLASLGGRLASQLPTFEFSPGQTFRGLATLPRILRGTARPEQIQEAASAATQLGIGAAGGVVLPLVQGEKPTAAGVGEALLQAALFGHPRKWVKRLTGGRLAQQGTTKKGTPDETEISTAGEIPPVQGEPAQPAAEEEIAPGTAQRGGAGGEEVKTEGDETKPPVEPPPEWPIRPVVQWQGKRFYGNTHPEAIGYGRATGADIPDDNEQWRGFETADGRFVDRKEAAKIFEAATGQKIERKEGLHSEDLIEAGMTFPPKGPQLLQSPGGPKPPELTPVSPWFWTVGSLLARRVRNTETGQWGVVEKETGLSADVVLPDESKATWPKRQIDDRELQRIYPELYEAPPPPRVRAKRETETADDANLTTQVLALHKSGISAASLLQTDPTFPKNKTALRKAIRQKQLPKIWRKLVNYEGGGEALDKVLHSFQGAEQEFGARRLPEDMRPDEFLDLLHQESRGLGGETREATREEKVLAQQEADYVAGQVKHELEILRHGEDIKAALSDNELGDVGVDFVTEWPKTEGNEPFARIPRGTIAAPINGRVVVHKENFEKWLESAKSPQQRQQMIAGLISEEAIHIRALQSVGNEGAALYWKTLTGLERRIIEDRYRGRGADRVKGAFSEAQLGHEAIRFRMQQLMRLTPREIAQLSGRERWSAQALTILENVVRALREAFNAGIPAAILSRVEAGLNLARAGSASEVPLAISRERKREKGMAGQPSLFLPPAPEAEASAVRPGATDLGAPNAPTPQGTAVQLERMADTHLAEAARPSFGQFVAEAKGKLPGVQPGQLAELWRDTVWKFLESAPARDLQLLQRSLGLNNLGFQRAPGMKWTSELAGPIAEPTARVPGEVSPELRQRALGDILKQVEVTPTEPGEGLEEEPGTSTLREPADQLARRNLIAAIGEKLIGEAENKAAPYQRESLFPSDVRTGTYQAVEEGELLDRAVLGKSLVQGGAVDRSTQQSIAGGVIKLKRQPPPASVTRSLVALVELKPDGTYNRNSPVHLVSAYEDHGQTYLFDPAKAGVVRPNAELGKVLGRFRPIARMLADEPVKNFHQRIESVREFRKRYTDELEGDWIAPEVSGPAELPTGGEMPTAEEQLAQSALTEMTGEELPQRKAQATRLGGVKPEQRLTADEAGALLDHVYDEVGGQLTEPQDVLDSLVGMADTKNYRLIAAVKKVMRVVGEKRPEIRGTDEALEQTLKLLYETAQGAATREDFQGKLLNYLGQGLERGRAGVEAARPGEPGSARELSMLGRRPPTDVAGQVPPEGPGPAPTLGSRMEDAMTHRMLTPEEMAQVIEQSKKRFPGKRWEPIPGLPEGLQIYREVPLAAGKASVEEDEPVRFMNSADPKSNLSYYQAAYKLARAYQGLVPDVKGFIGATGLDASPVLEKAWEDAAKGQPSDPAAVPMADPREFRPRNRRNLLTQVMGAVEDKILGRPHASQAADVLALAQAQDAIASVDSNLTQGERLGNVIRPNRATGGIEFVGDGFNYDAAGHRLIGLVEGLLGDRAPAEAPYVLSALINSIRANHRLGKLNDVFSEPVRDRLYQLTQSEASHYGLMLHSLQRFGDFIEEAARDVRVYLKREWRKELWGDEGRFFDSLYERIQDRLTQGLDPILADTLRTHPEMQAFLDRVIREEEQDSGNRVYRRFQSLMKPKMAKKLGKLLSDTRVREAVEKLLAEAKAQGMEPKGVPGKKRLTPIEELLYLATPENSKKVENLLVTAIWQAQRNAARPLVEARLASSDDMALYDTRTLDPSKTGPDPTDAEVNQGLQSPHFAHWGRVRDTFLGYDPVTLKLVQDVLKGDFKGTRFAAGKAKPVDTRIDLEKLAKALETEVARVLDGYLANIENGLESVSGASPHTQQRIRAMMMAQLSDQLAAIRQRIRDPLFRDKVAGKKPLTAEERMLELVHAGLFGDARLDIPGMVERVAQTSAVRRLLPKLGDLTKEVFATPAYQQEDLRLRFGSVLANRLGIDEDQIARAWQIFDAAFGSKFAEAREKAAKAAIDSLAPAERAKRVPRALYDKIVRLARAGGLDSGALLQGLAVEKGWPVPSDADVEKMRSLVEREERLRQVPEPERAALEAEGASPEDLEKTRSEHEEATRSERDQVKKELERLWARWRYPFKLPNYKDVDSWRGAWEQKRNLYRAMHEYATLGLITKIGFPVRIFEHLTTQLVGHAVIRPMARAWELFRIDRQQGNPHEVVRDVVEAYADGIKGWAAALRPAVHAMRAELSGRGDIRNVDRLLAGVNGLERMAEQARNHMAQWRETRNPLDLAKGVLMHLWSIPRLMGWVISAVDQWQGVPAEYQDILHRIEISAREAGMDRATSAALRENIFKELKSRFVMATSDAERMLASHPERQGAAQPPSDFEIGQAAWNLVLHRAYRDIERAGLPAGDIRNANFSLRRTLAWQEPVSRGVGGIVGGQIVRKLPLTWGAFANAIGHSINYAFMWLPPPLHWLAEHQFPGQPKEHSGWYATDLDRKQRMLQSLVGTAAGGFLTWLVYTGILRVIPHNIADKNERERLEKAGHKPGTVEVVLDQHSFIPFSMTVGPFQPMAPYLAGAGAAYDLHTKRVKQQQALNERAAKLGIAPGKIADPDVGDYMAIAGATAWQTILGSKTAAGWTSQFLEPGRLEANIKRSAAQFVQPLIPFAPAWNELARMDGVALDRHLASVWDYLVPLPTSRARAVNALGDPVGTPNDLQRVIQTITAGTFPGVVRDDEQGQASAAYAALEKSGYKPPAIVPGKAYNVNGTLRPLTDGELEKYTAERGQLLKGALAGLGAGATLETAKAAFQQADQAALASVGAAGGRVAVGRGGKARATGARAKKAGLPAAGRVKGRLSRSTWIGRLGGRRGGLLAGRAKARRRLSRVV